VVRGGCVDEVGGPRPRSWRRQRLGQTWCLFDKDFDGIGQFLDVVDGNLLLVITGQNCTVLDRQLRRLQPVDVQDAHAPNFRDVRGKQSGTDHQKGEVEEKREGRNPRERPECSDCAA